MGTVKQRRRHNPITIEFAVSMAVGLVASLALLLSMLLPSGGTEPRGICDFVEGTQGLLPLNPNEGGSVVYSCDPNFVLLLWYIFMPAVIVASVWFLSVRFIRDFLGI